MAERLREKDYPRITGGIDSLFAEGAIWRLYSFLKDYL
jgi:hypothetical protein